MLYCLSHQGSPATEVYPCLQWNMRIWTSQVVQSLRLCASNAAGWGGGAQVPSLVGKIRSHNFPGGSDGKASVYKAGDLGSIPGLGRSSGEENGTPLQYSYLKNPMDRGAWWATVHGVAKSQTQLSDFTLFLYFLWFKANLIVSLFYNFYFS